MPKILIFGNSGSGKSTLAKKKVEALACSHLDLDTVAWQDGLETPKRKPLAESDKQIRLFRKLFASYSGTKREYTSNERPA